MISRIHSWTVPIYTREGNERPMLLGTGVLIDANGSKILLTAKHVTDRDKQGLFLPGNNKLIGVIADIYSQRWLNASFSKQEPFIDASVCILKEHTAEKINSSHIFAKIGEHLSVSQPLVNQSCLIFGYPATKTIRRIQEKEISNQALKIQSFVSEIHLKPSGTMVSFDVLFKRDHKHQSPRFAPDPHGMSGCGVWGVIDSQYLESNVYEHQLLGIAVEYYAAPKSRIRCVPLPLILGIE
jgi:hypothetical protein